MTERELVPLESWLELLCQMIPGVSRAVLIADSSGLPARQIQWPKSADIDDDVMSVVTLAESQKKTVTTTFAAGHGNDSSDDVVIAIPLSGPDNFNAILAVRVRVKPSQQSVVMQILRWGESWLQLLLRQHASGLAPDIPEPALSGPGDYFQRVKTTRPGLIVLALFLLVTVLSLIPGTYRVTAPANLEGSIQRVIVAPFDGYIANAFARAGESVAANDVIAELDSRELVLQQQRYLAEKNEYTRQYRQALASRDKAQAHIYKSQINQADAQLQLLEKKIQRSRLVAPLDGVIISGDLSRSLGSTVNTGDVLFEVAPLDAYRLIILVDEKQVVDIQPGLRGLLSLKALPAAELEFVVHKVSPVFEENVSGIAYRVEAMLDQNHPALRPGMQGIAKIEIGQRSYAWIYLHELYDAIRLWLWSWLP